MSLTISSATLNLCSQIIDSLADRQQHGIATVGVFDSGVGGLSVLPTLVKPPQFFDVYYRGDTAHFPYGEKTAAELLPLVIADLEYLVVSGCSVIGIACNTASIIWRTIVAQLPARSQDQAKSVILDTISVAITALGNLEQHHTIGIIGTSFTVQSGAYLQAIKAQFPGSTPVILQSAEQSLIYAIERGEQKAINQELTRIINHFSQYNLDVFILGCTHYGQIAPKIAAILPENIRLLDPSKLLGKALRDHLQLIPIAKPLTQTETIIKFTGETS